MANIGSADRIFRVLFGAAALWCVFFGPMVSMGWEKVLLAIVGLVLIGTSAIKFCPAYRIFGISTCSKE